MDRFEMLKAVAGTMLPFFQKEEYRAYLYLNEKGEICITDQGKPHSHDIEATKCGDCFVCRDRKNKKTAVVE